MDTYEVKEYTYEELEVGLSHEFSVTITEKMMDSFREMSGDCNPLHTDTEFAQARNFPNRVVYGMLTASFISQLGVYLPGKNCLIHSVEINFVKPVFPNDTLNVSGTVVEKNDTFRQLTIKIIITNQHGEKVCRGKLKAGVFHE